MERLPTAKEELFQSLSHDEMAGVSVVVIANKQDLPNAMTPTAIAHSLELNKLTSQHSWHIQGACGLLNWRWAR